MDPHEELVIQKKLPQVGQTVRSKKHGTLWKVFEKRQIYSQAFFGDTSLGDFKLVPAIYLIYWKIEQGKQLGIGKMLGYAYTLHDNTFEANWELAG
jgi:hypothetical protein